MSQAPTLNLSLGALSAYSENAGALLIDSAATITDSDSTTFKTLKVSLSSGGTTDDLLLIRNSQTSSNLTTVGALGVGNGVIYYNFGLAGGGPKQVATYTGGLNNTPLVITFNATATKAAAQKVLQSIVYGNLSDNPTAGDRTVQFELTDDTDLKGTASRTITLTAVNDAPVIGAPGATLSLFNGTGTPNSQGFVYQTAPDL
ncbi:MAG TPA: hypothetical protein V6C88_00655, partial [Chroococcidiopsis sp.]